MKSTLATTYDLNSLAQETWTNEDGIIHREEGPAQVERYSNGDGTHTTVWKYLQNGKYHRLDGPAIIYENSNNDNQYWYYGKKAPSGISHQWQFEQWLDEYFPNWKKQETINSIKAEPLKLEIKGIDISTFKPAVQTFKTFIHDDVKIKTKEKPKMENQNKDFVKMIKQDAEKSAYRTGATQGIKAVKAGISKALSHEGMDAAQAAAASKFLDTEIGEMLLRFSLGLGLTYVPIPGIQNNEYAQKVSEELRVSGLEKGMTRGAELLQQFIVPALSEVFANNPIVEKIMNQPKQRISDAEEEIPVELEELTSEEPIHQVGRQS